MSVIESVLVLYFTVAGLTFLCLGMFMIVSPRVAVGYSILWFVFFPMWLIRCTMEALRDFFGVN